MATEIQLDTAVNTANSAKTLRELSKSLRELVALQGQIGEGSADFKKLQAAINDTEGRVGDLNDSFNTLRGSGIERVNSSLALFRDGINNADTGKLKIALEGIGSAMKAIPIFLLIEGLKYAYENFDKFKSLLNNIIPSWKAQADAIKLNIDYINTLSSGIENLKVLNEEFYADADAETAKEVERLKRAGKNTEEINNFIIESNVKRLDQLQQDYEDAVDEQINFTKYALAAEKKLKDNANDEEAKVTVEAYKKLQQQTNDASKRLIDSRRAFSVQDAQLQTANYEFRVDLLKKEQESADKKRQEELQSEIDALRRKEELNQRRLAEEKQTYEELEAMLRKSIEKRDEIEDIAFINSLNRGKKEFEIEQASRERSLNGRLALLEQQKERELLQVSKTSEASYLIEKKYAELAFREKVKYYGQYVGYLQSAAGLISEYSAIQTQNENYQIQQRNYQRDAEIETIRNLSQSQINEETNKTNKILENDSLTSYEREKIKYESDKRINEINASSASAELAIKKSLDAQSLEIRRNQFEREKKIQLVTASLNTAAAVVSALGTVQPFPAALVAAGIAAAAGAFQIKKISDSKFDDGGVSASNTVAPISTSITQQAPTQAATTNFNNNNSGSQAQGQLLGNGLTTNSNGIVKVVVLESDIREAVSKVDVLESRSTFGI